MMTDPATFLLSSLAFANEAWAWVAGIFVIVAGSILVLTYRNSHLHGGAKVVAVSLKGLGLFLLALALLEPVLLDESPKKNANDVVVLADNSAGMSVALEDGERSPAETMRGALVGADEAVMPSWLDEISRTFRLRSYLFDRGLRQSADFSDLDFTRNHSALIDALDGIDSRFENRPLAAMVVLSDGNATDAGELDAYLEGREGVPVFPIVVGVENESLRDLAITRVSATETQFEDARVTLEVEASARGEISDPVEVFVRSEKGDELARKAITFSPDSAAQKMPVRFRLAAIPPGISFLTVGIESDGAEVTVKNNTQGVVVEQGSGPYRILYLSGRPNWEYKFLRRSISEDSELDLVGLIRIAKREPKFVWRGREGESSNPLFRGFEKDIPEETQKYDEPVLIRLNTATADELRGGFPRTAEDLFSQFQTIIIDDLEADFFTQEQQNLVEEFVSRRGGSVIMLGGQESFQQGGWDNTPVGRILPVYLDQLGKGGASLEATYDLTREGWLEPWMRLRAGQEEEYARLAYMPPFFSINQVSAIKPGARILATVVDSEERKIPAFVTQRYGEGKTAALTVGDLWRWAMKDAEQQIEVAKSWRQILRWSVNDVPSRVEMEKENLDAGALPLTKLSVRVRDEAFAPQDEATVLLEVTDLEGEVSKLSAEPSLAEPGLFTAEYLSEDSAGYRVKASVLDGDGLVIGEDVVARALNPEAQEYARLGPNPDLLQKIADRTQGEMLRLESIDELPALLAKLELPVMEISERPLWHAPWLFLLALGCFLGEWAIRRRAGVL